MSDTVVPEIATSPNILRWIVIIILAAIGYTVATIGMKYAALNATMIAICLILLGFLLATLAEVFLLRRGDLSVVYVTIIGVETLMILAASYFFGEAIDIKRAAGAACVVAGIALCSA